ncbi:MAG: zeta toxin family protein [Planctomycetaceae bacterium]
MPVEPEQPTVYVIAGPNGAGKTTFATTFLPGFVNCREFVNADLIAAGLSPFDPDSQAVTAGRLMLQRIDSLVQERQSFGFETTLAGRVHATRLARMRSTYGYRVILIFVWLPSETMAISRVAERVKEGGHNVPTETVKRRYHQGIWNFRNLYRNIAETWYILDGTRQPPETVCFGDSENTEVIHPHRLAQIRRDTPELVP